MIAGVHHVKIPVSDVARSREWYERVLGMQVALEFVEDGALMGLALADPAGTVQVALRHDPDRAAVLADFDPLALSVRSRDDIEVWRRALDELGEPHGGVVTGSTGGSVLVGLRDPDGIEIRLYAD
jgi:catechol 2,3-dioxygenase-like lactoylglutathione lyase family enzyme